ncbi:flagella associated protein [Angomonas deanei]|uniref:EFHB C-terminal EF-hand domain-containing protein n=1 Tax=Angomonas deanei TaxID=59799 RepID=A0A7G2C0K6_9TRYP|nr:flagella associated protein [Angomonas deanei]CAD2212854.1 hypothetical protein, conserved [Angomonas deanei]|eukprot:EPY29115.1 flagella associated protein [Angomonas deanei]
MREKNYKSSQQRPLGRGPLSANPVETPHEGFGVPTAKSESAKATMNAMRDVDVVHPAGQQLNRNYDWESKGVNPTQHRFGAHSDKGQSAQEALATSGETQLIPRIMKDYDSISKAELGKSKPYGFDNPEEWDPKAVSRKQKTPEPSVDQLLSSWTVDPNRAGEDVTLDATGSSRARMLQNRKAEDNRQISSKFSGQGGMGVTYTEDAHGRTVIQTDVMGDEATAPQLVNPSHYVSLGVQSKYFAGGRDLEGIRALCHKCGFGMSDGQIDEVFNANAKNGLCGIEQFKNAATAKGYI